MDKLKAVFEPTDIKGSYKLKLFLTPDITEFQRNWAYIHEMIFNESQLPTIIEALKKDDFEVEVINN